jgi:hypothetical protein
VRQEGPRVHCLGDEGNDAHRAAVLPLLHLPPVFLSEPSPPLEGAQSLPPRGRGGCGDGPGSGPLRRLPRPVPPLR